MSAVNPTDIVPGSAPYPLNHWYVAAFTEEVTVQPLHRKILGQPMVFYRTGAGEVAALLDSCPHRGMPLSEGRVQGENLQCAYHGIEFSATGACTHIPSGGVIPPRMCVRSFPVVECWRWIWVWAGDPDLADPDLVPDHRALGFDKPGWYAETGPLLSVRANYLMSFENLLDASHISFLHHGQIDTGEVALKQPRLEEQEGSIRVIREMLHEKQSEYSRQAFQLSGVYADRTITAEALPPSICCIKLRISPSADKQAPPRFNQLIMGITPQTERTTLEFTAVSQTFPFELEGWDESLRALLMEDVVAMEAIQARFEELDAPLRKEISVRADAGAMRARRAIGQMLAEENRLPGKQEVASEAPAGKA